MTIREYLKKNAFQQQDAGKYGNLEVFDLGSTRVCWEPDDETWSLIKFDGRVGYSSCKWQINFPNVPEAIVLVTIKAAIGR